MSAVIILKLLRENKLEDYYPNLLCNGIHNVKTLTNLTISDCKKYGIKEEADQIKIIDLAKEAVRIYKEENSTTSKKRSNPSDNASSAQARRRNAANSSQKRQKKAKTVDPEQQDNDIGMGSNPNEKNKRAATIQNRVLKEQNSKTSEQNFIASLSQELKSSTIQSSQQKSDHDLEESNNNSSASPSSPLPLPTTTSSPPSAVGSNNTNTSSTTPLKSFFENETDKHEYKSPPRPEVRKRPSSYISPMSSRQTKQIDLETSTTNNSNRSSETNTSKSPRRISTNFTPLHQQSNFEEYATLSSSQPRVIQKKALLLDSYGIPISKKKQTENNNNTSVHEPPLQRTGSLQNQPFFESNDRLDKQISLGQRISVCVRKRPLSSREKELKEVDIAHISGANTIHVNAPKLRIDLTGYTEEYPFTFDETFDSDISTKEVYKRTAKPLVNFIFRGGKATCFAYGQTGSGKTYTMLHPKDGLYIQAANDVFNLLAMDKYSHLSVHLAFYEIYQNQIYDLLNNKMRLSARADRNNNVVISGLKEVHVNSVNELMKKFELGANGRTTGQTGANNTSSRSHAILQIVLKDGSNKKHGKFSFIDLAGSERGQDRGDADAKTRMEGAEINKSLLALKECIRALDQSQKHTPFRGSKLTHVLRDSFTGSSRTCMIANISPNSSNSEHTLNTLRYADRVKELKGQSDPRLLNKQNIDSSDLEELQDNNKKQYPQRTHSKTKIEEEYDEMEEEYDDNDDEIQPEDMKVVGEEEDEEQEEEEEEEKEVAEEGTIKEGIVTEDLIYQENDELDFLAMQRAHISELEKYIRIEKTLLEDYSKNHKLTSRDEYERYLLASKKLKWQVNDSIIDVSKRLEYELRNRS